MQLFLDNWETVVALLFVVASIIFGQKKVLKYKEKIQELIKEIGFSIQDGRISENEMLRIIKRLKEIFKVG